MDSDLVRRALLACRLLSMEPCVGDAEEIAEHIWRRHLENPKLYSAVKSAVKAAGSESAIIFTLEPYNLLRKKCVLKCDFFITFIEIMTGLKEHEDAG